MNILKEIVSHKIREVDERKELYPVKLLEKSIYFDTPVVSLSQYLKRPDKVGIIAEIKRRSPSRGAINPYIDVEQVSIGYMQAGASALSVLTDAEYFGGSNDDLRIARKYNYCPILRKDFVVDEYQLFESKSIGADAVLLIAACLTPEKARSLASTANALGLETLLEVHSTEEVNSHLDDVFDLIGVNNRNLETFEVNIDTSKSLAAQIPDRFTRVSESGISSAQTIRELTGVGYDGFLIGEYFMQNAHPHLACQEFVRQIESAHKLKSPDQ